MFLTNVLFRCSGSPVVIDRIYSVFLNVTETLNDVIKTDEETKTMVE